MQNKESDSPQKRPGFWPLVLLFNGFLTASLVLMWVWRTEYSNGFFQWRLGTLNFHVLFMCLGFLALYAFGEVWLLLSPVCYMVHVTVCIKVNTVLFICNISSNTLDIL